MCPDVAFHEIKKHRIAFALTSITMKPYDRSIVTLPFKSV